MKQAPAKHTDTRMLTGYSAYYKCAFSSRCKASDKK